MNIVLFMYFVSVRIILMIHQKLRENVNEYEDRQIMLEKGN